LSCGQVGTIQRYKFYKHKNTVENEIKSYFIKKPNIFPTKDWEIFIKEINEDASFLKFYYLYNNMNSEMYVFKFSNTTQDLKSNNCVLSFTAVVRYSEKFKRLRFYQESDLDEIEISRLKNNFEKLLLKKFTLKYKKLSFWESDSE
jgi:hypothetical protein